MSPELGPESSGVNAASAIARWLDHVDDLGEQVPVQMLTDRDLPHPLRPTRTLEDHQINLQLGVITAEMLDDGALFYPDKVKTLIMRLDGSLRNDDLLPRHAVDVLIEKQMGYLKRGESWQFAKVGLEVSPQAQRIAFKLHALQGLIEPFARDDARQYGDQISDIYTQRIHDRSSQMRILAGAIGPMRFSVRWTDFLEGGENPDLISWIQANLGSDSLPQRDVIGDKLLHIAAGESPVNPGTTIQILERRTFRSTGNIPPLRPEDVANGHYHHDKVEVYLPLMGPGMLKIQYGGTGRVYTYTPDPNIAAHLDLSKIGAKMIDGQPAVVYDGGTYRAVEGQRIISIPLGGGKYVQFYTVRPGDVHDFQNVGISPASAYALAMGFPREEGLDLSDDFIASKFESPKITNPKG